MLRDEATGSPALHDVLEQFRIDDDEVLESVLEFRKLGADRFIWKLQLSENIYYLYAEDFVESLEQVTDTLQIVTDGTPGELVPAKTPLDFENASPVTSASVYEKPTDFDEKIAHYSGESGYDFVFLYRTDVTTESDLF